MASRPPVGRREGFNPRARVGRDPAGLQERASRPGFNPRARVGRDEAPDLQPGGLVVVSIHAPAWGATLPLALVASFHPGFNPRARVGRDNARRAKSWVQSLFQSTRPRGARQPHHNSLRDKDFFRVTREPMLSLDPKGTGQVAATQKPMKSISC